MMWEVMLLAAVGCLLAWWMMRGHGRQGVAGPSPTGVSARSLITRAGRGADATRTVEYSIGFRPGVHCTAERSTDAAQQQ